MTLHSLLSILCTWNWDLFFFLILFFRILFFRYFFSGYFFSWYFLSYILSAHTFARNWQVPFLNQQKGENDCTNILWQLSMKECCRTCKSVQNKVSIFYYLNTNIPGETFFFRNPEISQTLTVWSREADTIRSSDGWNWAHITKWLCPANTL